VVWFYVLDGIAASANTHRDNYREGASMATEWAGTTTVQTVTIRAVGDVDGHVDVTYAGTPEAIVTVAIGPALIRLYQADVAFRIREGWKAAAVSLHRLPEAVSTTWAVPVSSPVGIVVRIGVDVTTTSALVPATRQLRRDHLRMQVGPLVWQVLDRAAYRSIVQLWERAEQMLA
jgi:hypothetical protein